AVAGFLVVATLVFLGSAFFRTQVIRNDDFTLRADENRMRVIPVPAPRGAVFDRNGELIAETVTSYSLHLQPTSLDSARVGLLLLQPVLGLSGEDVERLVGELEHRPGEPLLLSRSLD